MTAATFSGIKPAFRAKTCGQAITVQLSKGDLVDPLKALEMGRPGDIIVADAGGERNTSVCGGLMGGLAQNRGIRGMIVDGAGRDTDELEDLNWPIWTRAITPRGTHTMFSGRKEELSTNVPIACGGIVVNPGDFVVADLMGGCGYSARQGRRGGSIGRGTGRSRGKNPILGQARENR